MNHPSTPNRAAARARTGLVVAFLGFVFSVFAITGCATEAADEDGVTVSDSEVQSLQGDFAREAKEASIALSSVGASETAKAKIAGLISWSVGESKTGFVITALDAKNRPIVRLDSQQVGEAVTIRIDGTSPLKGVYNINARGEAVGVDPTVVEEVGQLLVVAINDTLATPEDAELDGIDDMSVERAQGWWGCGKAVLRAVPSCGLIGGAGAVKAAAKAIKALYQRNLRWRTIIRIVGSSAGYDCGCSLLAVACQCFSWNFACRIEHWGCI